MNHLAHHMGSCALILWVFVNVLSLSNAITCSDLVQCEPDLLNYSSTQVKGDIAKQCSLLGKSLECLEAAMDDCRSSSNFPKDRLSEVQHALDTRRQQLLTNCPVNDQASAKATASQRSWVNPTQSTHGPGGIPRNPVCTDIMACMFDLGQFKAALRNNRLAEACSLINPSVKCLRVAIRDCKENRLIDSDDMTNATHSLTDAEKLLENYCGYTRDQESTKDTPSQEKSEIKRSDGQTRNESKPETNSQEQSLESRTKKNSEGGYETFDETKKSSSGHSGREQGSGHNTARGLCCRLLFVAVFLIFLV